MVFHYVEDIARSFQLKQGPSSSACLVLLRITFHPLCLYWFYIQTLAFFKCAWVFLCLWRCLYSTICMKYSLCFVIGSTILTSFTRHPLSLWSVNSLSSLYIFDLVLIIECYLCLFLENKLEDSRNFLLYLWLLLLSLLLTIFWTMNNFIMLRTSAHSYFYAYIN